MTFWSRPTYGKYALSSGSGTDIGCKLRAAALHLAVAETQKLAPYRSQSVIVPLNSGTQRVLRSHLCIRWTYDKYVPPSGSGIGIDCTSAATAQQLTVAGLEWEPTQKHNQVLDW